MRIFSDLRILSLLFRMKKQYNSWDECLNLREVKVYVHIFTPPVVIYSTYVLLTEFEKDETSECCQIEGDSERE